MSTPRIPLWAAEAQADEELQDVDLSLAIGNYGQQNVNGLYDADGEALAQQMPIDESTLLAMQQHMVQQAAFAQIPDVVKRVSPSWTEEFEDVKLTCIGSSSSTSTKL
jgi:translation initiation factor 3 subunit L